MALERDECSRRNEPLVHCPAGYRRHLQRGGEQPVWSLEPANCTSAGASAFVAVQTNAVERTSSDLAAHGQQSDFFFRGIARSDRVVLAGIRPLPRQYESLPRLSVRRHAHVFPRGSLAVAEALPGLASVFNPRW